MDRPDTVIPILSHTLQASFDIEKKQWSNRYGSDAKFKKQIDDYYLLRQKFIADLNAGHLSKEQIHTQSRQLGTDLAVAYGYFDHAGMMPLEVVRKIEAGGAHYANASIQANTAQQMPGILRSAAVAAVSLATGAGAIGTAASAAVLAGINLVYVVAQAAVSYSRPFSQARQQSVDVAMRGLRGPNDIPDISASKLIKENGTPGSLKGVPLLEKQIRKLEELAENKPGLLEKTKNNLDDRKNKIEEQITKIQESQDSHEKREKKQQIQPQEHIQHKKLVKKLRELDQESNLYDDIYQAQLQTEGFNSANWSAQASDAINEKLGELRRQLAIEEIYTQLSYQPNQGDSKNSRNFWTAATAFAGVGGSAATSLGLANPFVSAGIQSVTLGMQVALVVNYMLEHPGKAAEDFASLITTQFQLAALTGVGNLAPQGNFDANRLDKIMIGPMKRRLIYMKNVAEFDRTVYRAAILTALMDDHGNMPQGSYQASATAFSSLKDQRARFNYVSDACAFSKHDSIEKIDKTTHKLKNAIEILKQYENNERNIALLTDGKIEDLLSNESTLPQATKDVLSGALAFASGDTTEMNRRFDDQLAIWKGLTESLTDLGSINQAAQKVAQMFPLYVGGPVTPLMIKALVCSIQACLYAGVSGEASSEVRQQLLDAINGLNIAGNATSFGAALFAFSIAYSAYEHIAVKELDRARDAAERGAAMPNAGLDALNFISSFFKESKPENFNTLAAAPIVEQPQPQPYESQGTFAADVKKQIEAPDLSKWLAYFNLKPATFEFRSKEDAKNKMMEALKLMQEINAEDAEKEQEKLAKLASPNENNKPRRRRETRAERGSRLSITAEQAIKLLSTRKTEEDKKNKEHQQDEEIIRPRRPLFRNLYFKQLAQEIDGESAAFELEDANAPPIDYDKAVEQIRMRRIDTLAVEDVSNTAYIRSPSAFEIITAGDGGEEKAEIEEILLLLGAADSKSYPNADIDTWRLLELVAQSTDPSKLIGFDDLQLQRCHDFAQELIEHAEEENDQVLRKNVEFAGQAIIDLLKWRQSQQPDSISLAVQ